MQSGSTTISVLRTTDFYKICYVFSNLQPFKKRETICFPTWRLLFLILNDAEFIGCDSENLYFQLCVTLFSWNSIEFVPGYKISR